MRKFDREKHIVTTPKAVPTEVMEPILYMDEKVIRDSFYLACHWLHGVKRSDMEPHTHDFDEVLAYLGSDPSDPHNLKGEVELHIGDESVVITESSLVFIPAGVPHCPIHINRLERPILHFSCGAARSPYERLFDK